MAVGTVATLVAMFRFGIEANDPIYWGLVSGLVVYAVGSLLSKPTDPEVLAEWDRRSRGESTAKITVQQTPSA
jgi:solute:Na+ symporter, SSS family